MPASPDSESVTGSQCRSASEPAGPFSAGRPPADRRRGPGQPRPPIRSRLPRHPGRPNSGPSEFPAPAPTCTAPDGPSPLQRPAGAHAGGGPARSDVEVLVRGKPREDPGAVRRLRREEHPSRRRCATPHPLPRGPPGTQAARRSATQILPTRSLPTSPPGYLSAVPATAARPLPTCPTTHGPAQTQKDLCLNRMCLNGKNRIDQWQLPDHTRTSIGTAAPPPAPV